MQPQWRDAFRQAYGHEPLYLMATGEEDGSAVLPAFIVRRPFVGPVVCSMPFLDSGGTCGSSERASNKLVQKLVERAAEVGAKFVELRCTTPLDLPITPNLGKVTMVLPLPHDPTDSM
ncbi:MAG: hypothetical protein O7C75_14350 [Verrucomicrobia bacterium]|nr:hypothetical protein [Verrucomicrobiota bacterium]